ncbi:hypothetical protein VULLAG_LOCUS2650 [Vulpes lagopus]
MGVHPLTIPGVCSRAHWGPSPLLSSGLGRVKAGGVQGKRCTCPPPSPKLGAASLVLGGQEQAGARSLQLPPTRRHTVPAPLGPRELGPGSQGLRPAGGCGAGSAWRRLPRRQALDFPPRFPPLQRGERAPPVGHRAEVRATPRKWVASDFSPRRVPGAPSRNGNSSRP